MVFASSKVRGRGLRGDGRTLLELLESRVLMSTVTWTGAGGNALWSNRNNWDTHAAPTDGDAALKAEPLAPVGDRQEPSLGAGGAAPGQAPVTLDGATGGEPLPDLRTLDETVPAVARTRKASTRIDALIAKNKVSYPVLKDRFNLVARRWLGNKSPLPSVFLVKPDGTILAAHRGYSEDIAKVLEHEVLTELGLTAAADKP